jgi:copper chaperone CopZ
MSKKLLKNLEGATIEKVSVDAANRKVKIKTYKGTITITFDDHVEAGSELASERVVDIAYKEAKPDFVAPPRPAPAQTQWPFPTGNKP